MVQDAVAQMVAFHDPAHGDLFAAVLLGLTEPAADLRLQAHHRPELGADPIAGAALGGVTAVFEMPNTKPSTTTAEALQYKLDRALNRMWCDHAFYVGAAAENVELLGELALTGELKPVDGVLPAALAAALLYAGKRKKKPNEPTQPGPIPSGEPPQTD